MSHVDSGSAGGKGLPQDFELNLASIIDCFTVLIIFLLASSSFLAIGMLDAGIAAGVPAPMTAPPPVQVTVELAANNVINVKMTGKATQNIQIKAIQDSANKAGWDYVRLTQQLSEIKKAWPTVDAVTLSADEETPYVDVVQSMEVTRKTMPAVLLGGF